MTSKDIDEVILVGGQIRMPKVQEAVKQLFDKEPHKGVNPDEVVAVGAAVQGAVLTGEVKDLLLLDVTPLSLGIETLGGVMTPLIPRNTTIPTKKSETFTTAADSQTSVEVHVLQGERPLARDNRTLGKFHLVGIPPAPRGVPQVEVTFDIDANGILNVSAKDRATGKQQNITITASSGLTKDEIERMVKDAEANAADDTKRKQEIEVRNQTDSLVYSTERTLGEHGGKLAEADRKAVDDALAEAREALKSEDLERMKRAQETLTQASHKLAEVMYREAQASRRAQRGTPRCRGQGAAGGGPRKAKWSTPNSRTSATRSRRHAARLLRGARRRGHGGAARGAPGVPAPRAAVLARRELLGRARAGLFEEIARGLSGAQRSARARDVRPVRRHAGPARPLAGGRRGDDVHVDRRPRRLPRPRAASRVQLDVPRFSPCPTAARAGARGRRPCAPLPGARRAPRPERGAGGHPAGRRLRRADSRAAGGERGPVRGAARRSRS